MERQGFAFAWSALLGFDIFISYRRSDGSAYAEKLWRDLKAAGITPFLDRAETPGGAQLTPSLVRALRRSRMLVILLTPDVLDSEWVQQEIETFSKFRGRAIVPINIDNFIAKHNLDGTRLARLKDYSWIEETLEGLKTGVPSELALAEIGKGFRKVRVRSISRAIIAAVMGALTVTAVTAVVQMQRAQREAEVALAAQTAAQAELVRTQDDSQSDLAAALAFDSLQRDPSSQAEQTLRATLEVLPIQLASFQTEGEVTDIAFPADAPGIVTLSSKNRKARLHDLSGKLVREFACPKSDVCEFAIKAGAVAVASPRPAGGSTMRILDLTTGKERATVDWEFMPATLVLDATARTIAGVQPSGRACVWTLASPGPPVCVDGPADSFWRLNANGKLLASRYEDEKDDEDVTWRVWNTQTGALLETTGGALRMSSTGRYTAVTSGDTRVSVRDLEKGTDLPKFQHEETIDGVAFDADDRLMATSSSAFRLRLWVFESDRPEAPVVTTVAATNRGLHGFTADGLGLVTEATNPRGGTDVLFWRLRVRDRDVDLVSKQRIHHEGSVYAVAAHADGSTYATLDDKAVVRVWDTRDGNLESLVRHEKEFTDEPPKPACRDAGSSWTTRLRMLLQPEKKAPAGAPDPSKASATDPCGRYFAVTTPISGGRDYQTANIYRTSTREQVATMAHSANVNSIYFSPDGRYVITGGEDHAIKVWDFDEQRQVSYVEMDTAVRSARFSDDGRRIIAVGDKDADDRFPVATYIWKTEDLLSAMVPRQMRRLSRDEWTRYLGSRAPLLPAR